MAAFVGVLTLRAGLRRSAADLGHVDVFHPCVFPVVYLHISFLFPTWLLLINGEPLLGFTRADLSPDTSLLVAVSLVTYDLGSLLALGRGASSRPSEHPTAPGFLLVVGRALTLLLIAQSVFTWIHGGAGTRGLAQTSFTTADSLSAFALVFAPAATLLLAWGGRGVDHHGSPRLLPSDLVLLSALLVMTSVNGARGSSLVIVLTVLLVYSHHLAKRWVIPVALLLVLVGAVVISAYRSGAAVGTVSQSPAHRIADDWSVATYSIGATAQAVPSQRDFEWGRTYLVSAVRQVPSPISNRLLGPPTDSASYIFRDLIHFNNPDQGLGYTLPAEGYLNFGWAGLIAVSLLYGAAVSYSHRWFRVGNRSLNCLYLIVVATLPLSVRSDALGAVKAVLYPYLLIGGVLAVARSVEGRRAYHGEGQ
ncbi:MAG: O-antigen polysaccharide polymerase Wzy [Nocardioidaceae bacterium]